MIKTPIYQAKNLANKLGGRKVLLKLESINPISHTFKDRGAISAVNEAKKDNNFIIAATCSNMGTAVSGAAAMAGIDSFIIVSNSAATITKKAIASFSTQSVIVKGDFNIIDDLVGKFHSSRPIPCINTSLHHYFKNGFKAILQELVEQLSLTEKYAIVVPTADGTLLSALIEEYESLSIKPKFRFVVAQPTGCAPIVDAINNPSATQYTPLDKSQTLIVPLSVRNPSLYGNQIINYVTNNAGIGVSVSDEVASQQAVTLSKLEGLFTDSVGGVVISAIEKINNMIDPDETIVGIMTGNGLIDYSDKPSFTEKVYSLQDAEKELSKFVGKYQ